MVGNNHLGSWPTDTFTAKLALPPVSEWGAEGANYSALYQMLTRGVPMPYPPHSIRT